MSNQNNGIGVEIRTNLIWPLLVGVIILIITGYYSLDYLNKVTVEYYIDADFIVQTGQKKIDKNIPHLFVDFSKIIYKKKELASLRIYKFRILNNSRKHLRKGASFYLQTKEGKPLPENSVVDILFHPQPLGNEIIKAEAQPYDSSYGHSIKINSSLPNNSYIILSILIDESVLKKINPDEIDLKKESRSSEKWQKIFSPESKITLSYLQLFILVIIGASVYGSTWLIISIFRKNYSTGMEIIDRLMMLLFKRTLFKK